MKLIAVDPGVHELGLAFFINGNLCSCELHKVDLEDSRTIASWVRESYSDMYVLENQQIYSRLQQKGDPNDLIELAHISGIVHGAILEQTRWMESAPYIVRPKPQEWKGNLAKKIHHNRLMQQYPSAQKLMDYQKIPQSKRHNVWDAIGLGSWAVNKLRVK